MFKFFTNFLIVIIKGSMQLIKKIEFRNDWLFRLEKL